jgi:hypothetical protein
MKGRSLLVAILIFAAIILGASMLMRDMALNRLDPAADIATQDTLSNNFAN